MLSWIFNMYMLPHKKDHWSYTRRHRHTECCIDIPCNPVFTCFPPLLSRIVTSRVSPEMLYDVTFPWWPDLLPFTWQWATCHGLCNASGCWSWLTLYRTKSQIVVYIHSLLFAGNHVGYFTMHNHSVCPMFLSVFTVQFLFPLICRRNSCICLLWLGPLICFQFVFGAGAFSSSQGNKILTFYSFCFSHLASKY